MIYTGRHRTPEQVTNTALQEDVDVVGVSILSGAHLPLMRRLVSLLQEKSMGDKLLIVGGMIPDKDILPLKDIGVKAVFTANSRFENIIAFIKDNS